MSQNKIAITGTIGSGKSALSAYLLGWDYMVIDADEVGRFLVEPESELLKEIDKAFPEGVLAEDGSLNREKLGEIIFNDDEKREKLNSIMHPAISKYILKIIEGRKGTIFFEVPLLFENRKELENEGLTFDEVWLVDADDAVRIERLMARDKISEEYAKQKIASQMSAEEKRALADKVFENSGDLMSLYNQVDKALEEMRGEEI